MFGNFAKIGRAAGAKFPNITSTINPKLYEQHRMIIFYYWPDKITHLNVKLFNRFIQLFPRTILDVNIIFSL